MTGSDLCIPRNETARHRYFQNKIYNVSQSCICERFMYSQPNNVGIGNEGIHKSNFRYSVYGMWRVTCTAWTTFLYNFLKQKQRKKKKIPYPAQNPPTNSEHGLWYLVNRKTGRESAENASYLFFLVILTSCTKPRTLTWGWPSVTHFSAVSFPYVSRNVDSKKLLVR
jgi:hypothetical protein